MEESQVIQGRVIGPVELEQVRSLLAAHPEWMPVPALAGVVPGVGLAQPDGPNQGPGGAHAAAQVGTAWVGDAADAALAFA